MNDTYNMYDVYDITNGRFKYITRIFAKRVDHAVNKFAKDSGLGRLELQKDLETKGVWYAYSNTVHLQVNLFQ